MHTVLISFLMCIGFAFQMEIPLFPFFAVTGGKGTIQLIGPSGTNTFSYDAAPGNLFFFPSGYVRSSLPSPFLTVMRTLLLQL
jgi:hypothetical protein